jgi:allophanate hydrolase
VPQPSQREFFGDPEAAALFETAIERLSALGGEVAAIDLAPFLDAAALLYQGAWLAERMAAIDAATGGRRDILHPVTRRVIEAGGRFSAGDAFRDVRRLAALRNMAEVVWRRIDLLLVPTAGTIYRLAEVEADPVGVNERLGRYTNFANLLDLSGLAVPNGFQSNGLPAGVTLLAPAFHDPLLAAIGAAFHVAAGLPLGATRQPHPQPAPWLAGAPFPYLPVAVLGAHLQGEALNGELVALGARFRRAARTASYYRLYALPDGKRPGLVRHSGGGAIALEIWDVPTSAIGAFLGGIAAPLGLGRIALDNGAEVTGFLCEAHAVEGARDITEFGGWRAWRASQDGAG